MDRDEGGKGEEGVIVDGPEMPARGSLELRPDRHGKQIEDDQERENQNRPAAQFGAQGDDG